MKRIFLILLLSINLNAVDQSTKELIVEMNEYLKFENGNDKKASITKAVSYMSYIDGVADILYYNNDICPTEKGASGSIYKIVTKHIQNNPELWNTKAYFIVSQSLFYAFPCKRQK